MREGKPSRHQKSERPESLPSGKKRLGKRGETHSNQKPERPKSLPAGRTIKGWGKRGENRLPRLCQNNNSSPFNLIVISFTYVYLVIYLYILAT